MLTSIYTIALFAGMISFLSPCIIPMVTVYFSLITGMSIQELEQSGKSRVVRFRIIINTLLFIAAFTLIFSLAGAASGKVADFLKENITLFNTIGGIMVIFLALKLMGFFKAISFRVPFLETLFERFRTNAPVRYLTTFLVGIFFAVACSHCIGPLLYSMLIFAGNTGSSYTGMVVMLMFSLGLGIPYLFMGITFGKSINLLKRLQNYQKIISLITGTILLLFGILMLLNKFTMVVEMIYKLIPIRLPVGM